MLSSTISIDASSQYAMCTDHNYGDYYNTNDAKNGGMNFICKITDPPHNHENGGKVHFFEFDENGKNPKFKSFGENSSYKTLTIER